MQLDPTHPSILYLATSHGLQKSEDAGLTWQLKNHGLEASSIRSLNMSSRDPNVLYAGTNGGGLYRSEDAGESWNRLPLILAPGN